MIGRFTQEDVYRGDGLNLYAYCGNNPVRYYEPSGFVSASKERPSALENELPEGGAHGDDFGNCINGEGEADRLVVSEKDGQRYVSGDRPVKINQRPQDKHIFGTHNYNQAVAAGEPRSILSENPNQLLNDYVGTGQKISDYKERVDFGKTIGQYYDPDAGTYTDTTIGIITYSKKGAHIIPARPK